MVDKRIKTAITEDPKLSKSEGTSTDPNNVGAKLSSGAAGSAASPLSKTQRAKVMEFLKANAKWRWRIIIALPTIGLGAHFLGYDVDFEKIFRFITTLLLGV